MIDGIFDTIVSVVTPAGKSGVGVIRISGKLSFYIAFSILRKKPKIRFIEYSSFWLNDDLQIDFGLSAFFKAPNSFTGEDVFEIYAHGNLVILNSLLVRSIELGARHAVNGEYSFRAYFYNKIDLIQAESINQLINTSYLLSSKPVLNILNGSFSKDVSFIMDKVLLLRQHIEANIDFIDDIKFNYDDLLKYFFDLCLDFECLYNKIYKVFLCDSFKVVIFGNTNVGKSSLFNALLGKSRSIVSNIPGTTRDYISAFFDHCDFFCDLIDTAGLNDVTNDVLEIEGISKTLEQIKLAHVLVYVIDITSDFRESFDVFLSKNMDFFSDKAKVFVIYNKIDMVNFDEKVILKDKYTELYLSAKTGAGISLFLKELKKIFCSINNDFYALNSRNYDLLVKVKDRIQICRNNIDNNIYLDVFASDLFFIHLYLSSIVGKNASEDLINSIFSEFCIGK